MAILIADNDFFSALSSPPTQNPPAVFRLHSFLETVLPFSCFCFFVISNRHNIVCG